MKKAELLARIVALENELVFIKAKIAAMNRPSPAVNPWTAPFPNHPPYVAPNTTPFNPQWLPPVTICDATRAQ